MNKEIYYKAVSKSLFKIKNSGEWFICAETKEEAFGLANKRSEYKMEDIELIGSCETILGTTDNYKDVIDFHNKPLDV